MRPDLVMENLNVTRTAILPKFGELPVQHSFNFNLERHEQIKRGFSFTLHLTLSFLFFSLLPDTREQLRQGDKAQSGAFEGHKEIAEPFDIYVWGALARVGRNQNDDSCTR
jgi:hypothetical protein